MQNREKNKKSSCSQGYMKSRPCLLFKHTGGFTLVELIVVIAILGILAGVGTVAYSGYVEQTKREMDKTTVSNITRGINSGAYLFQLDTPLQLSNSGVTIPVGFVLITSDGTKSLQSGTSMGSESKECRLETKTFVTEAESYTYESGCSDVTAYVIKETESITYCATHSTIVEETLPVGSSSGDTSPVDTTVYRKTRCKLITDHEAGTVTETPVYGTYTETSDGVLHEIMSATYGSGFENTVKLQSDTWTVSSIPSFYAGSADLWDEVKSLSDELMDITGGDSNFEVLGRPVMNDDHASSAELVTTFAGKVVGLTEDTFIGQWMAVSNSPEGTGSTWANEDFGLGSAGREYYAAARKAYNSCFASYVRAQGHDESHAAEIANFARYSYLPVTVCREAFTDGYYQLPSEVKNCETCRQLYEDYVSSGAAEANGRAFFKTMQSVSETGEAAMTASGVDFFDYYASYLEEFSGLYSSVQREAQESDSCIVISVFSTNGKLTYEVSPTDAAGG